jgi:hypothetical protein
MSGSALERSHRGGCDRPEKMERPKAKERLTTNTPAESLVAVLKSLHKRQRVVFAMLSRWRLDCPDALMHLQVRTVVSLVAN